MQLIIRLKVIRIPTLKNESVVSCRFILRTLIVILAYKIVAGLSSLIYIPHSFWTLFVAKVDVFVRDAKNICLLWNMLCLGMVNTKLQWSFIYICFFIGPVCLCVPSMVITPSYFQKIQKTPYTCPENPEYPENTRKLTYILDFLGSFLDFLESGRGLYYCILS